MSRLEGVLFALTSVLAFGAACSSESTNASGGASGVGGSATGGTSSGGSATGGTSSGGTSSGGTSSGGGGVAGVAVGSGGQAGDATVADGTTDSCVPLSCGQVSAQCGAVPDGCGVTLNCGGCGVAKCNPDHNCCPSGVTAFDAALVGTVCGAANAVVKDGKVAGLDYQDTGGKNIDGHTVSACVGIDFGAVYGMSSVIVRASSAASGCSSSCAPSCIGGQFMSVFRGTLKGSYTFVSDTTLKSTLADYTIALGGSVRFVVVCRPGGGSAHDDVQVDAVDVTGCI